jgi:phosphonate transport system substrate-binding protein
MKIRFSGSHPATAAMVETGVVDAGAIDETIYEFLIAAGKLDPTRVRVIYTSKPYVDYVWVAGRKVSDEDRRRFTRAMLALQPDRHKAILKILRAKKFLAASDEEYAAMRRIAHNLNMY